MNKYSPLLFVMIFSFLFGDANVQIRLQNGQKSKGEFIGTYMNHVHILIGEKIIYYSCDDIISIIYTSEGLSTGKGFNYDCSRNTVTADILFPPQLDPMTGEMTQMLPDVFNPDIPKPAAKVEDGLKLINKIPKQMKEEMGIKVEAGGVSTEPHPKVNSDLKNISIKHLTKEQKQKYNQNKIIIKYRRSGKSGLDLLFDNWYASQKSIFIPVTFNKVEFFIFTGYPEKAEIEKYNEKLLIKSMFRLLSCIIPFALLPTMADEFDFWQNDLVVNVIFAGPLIYSLSYYSKNKLEGASIKDAKIIAEKYNNDLMQKIFNEND
ncbi:MAG: hypothetical protein P8J35_02530 [Candidatus Marinimicrobia bacterium]|nr:hypothetical protein [Candidatus Neomarinimicrobiota bacterium]